MSHGGYDAFDDPYCYKGTFVLKNKAGLRHLGTLQKFELEMSSLRATEPFPDGQCDSTHYKALHHHLFQDVYRWAGQYRKVRTAKGGNVFCYPEHIVREMERLFERLKGESFREGSSLEEFADTVTSFLAELNAIHPFREGNGRSQLSFLDMIALRAGHPLDLTKIVPDSFLAAMIESFKGELRPLKAELTSLIR